MSYQPTTRSRAYREGVQSRRRKVRCLNCEQKFQVDTLRPLEEKLKLCPTCKQQGIILFPFVLKNRKNGRDYYVPATDAELATLRAWRINPDLTLKVPQGGQDA